MSQAFEVTQEDLWIVLLPTNNHLKMDSPELEKLFNDVIAPESYRIEKAALYGNDLDEQTEYAHEEIAKILQEKNIIS